MRTLDHKITIQEAKEAENQASFTIASQSIGGLGVKRLEYFFGEDNYVVSVNTEKTQCEHSFGLLAEAVECYNNQ